MQTWADVVRSRAEDSGGGIRFEDRAWSWADVVAEGATRAALLESLELQPGERQVHVGVLLGNVPDFVFWIAGSALAGAVVVGLNSSRSGPEIAADLALAEVDVVVTERSLRPLLDSGDHGLPAARVLDVDEASYADRLAAHAASPLPASTPPPEAIAMLLFSSGSTGTPKAVIVGQGRLGRLSEALVERTRMRRDSVAYLCMPLFHGNAVMLNLATAMRVGATVALTRRFSASRFSDDVHRHGVTFVNYVGRALSYVLATPPDPRDAGSTLELAFGTEASQADAARFAERFGCEVVEGYGLSEGVFRIGRTPDTPAGALGLPAGDADVRILDPDTGEECPRARFDSSGRLVDQAAVGEIVAVGGAAAFEGYWRNPAAMAERVRGADFWSGDLGYRDEAGFFWFAGRSGDWLRVDSENFAAAPVERLLQRLPGVLAAPVYAVPDPVTGDQVMTALELSPGTSFDPDAFGASLSTQPDLGAKWWPRFVRVVDRVPTTGSNKVDKAPLRREAWECADPVFVRETRSNRYRLMTDDDRARLRAEFAAHGRAGLLPAP